MVSVCLASYNGEKFIREQITSILPQLGQNDELIISDDGSTDSTIDIIRSIEDKRIKLIHGGFHNFRLNFENALLHSKGEYIFLSDQDDVWINGKYSRCLEMLQTYDLVVTDSIVTDENLNVIEPSFFDYYHCGKGIVKNIMRSTYFGSCMAFRRSLLERALPIPRTIELAHDIWIGLVAEMTGSVHFLKEPYLLYRRHNGTFSVPTNNLLTRSRRSMAVKIRGRMIVLYHVVKYYIAYRKSYFVKKR